MTTNQRIILTALVLTMITTCSGETAVSPTESFNTRPRENKAYNPNQSLTTATALPVSPHVFSVDDYDVLQDAESLQQALSIVAYESQKINTKKPNISKTIETFEKATRPLYATTQLSNQRNNFEVPRKQSNIKAYTKQEKESTKGSRLIQETSSPKRTFEKVQNYDYSPTQATSSEKNHHETFLSSSDLPFHYSLTEETSLEPFLDTQSNYSVTAQYNNNNNNNNNNSKVDQTGSETLKTEVDIPILKKKGRTTEVDREPIQNDYSNYYHFLEPTNFPATRDRIPRPFSLSNEDNPTTRSLSNPTHTASIRQNIVAYPTVLKRQNIVSSAVPVEHPTSSTRQNLRPTSSTRPEQLAYSRIPSSRNRTYSRPALKADPMIAHRTIPPRRNRTVQSIAKQQTEAHSTIPVELESVPLSAVQPTQEQPIVYSYTKRPEHITVRSTSLLKQDKAIGRSIIPTEIYATVPTRQYHVATNQNVLPTLGYQTIQRRRKPAHRNIAKEQPEIHSTVPAKQQHSNPVAKQRVVPEEGNLGYPTIVQPTYSWANRESVDQNNKETKSNSSKQDNNDDKDYSGNESYNDSSENSSNSGYNDDDTEDDENEDDESKNNSNQYSYNYKERYEEPIEEEPTKHSHTYKVKEDNSEQLDHEPQRIKGDSTYRSGVYKKINPDYDQDHPRYIDYQSSEQYSDYDQARGQNTQHEVADVPRAVHQPKGDHQDLVEEADHQHKKHHKPESHDGAEGHHEEDHENAHHTHHDKGHKGYKQFHEHDKAEKGHHDKEGHNHDYDEKEGKHKKHHEAAGFHEEHQKGEEGEKKTAFKEKGNHKKGHSTKGEHVIHKKDEFEKKTEFFDEFHEGGDMDKDGGYHEEHHHKKGGHHKKGHHHEGEDEKKHGEKGKYDKGHHHFEKKGHDEHEGHEQHHHHDEKHGKKGGHEDAKKWSSKKGDKR